MTYIFPKPIREMIDAWQTLKKPSSQLNQQAAKADLANTVCSIAFAALEGAAWMAAGNAALPIIGVIGAVVSLRATLIAGGSGLIYFGVATIVSAIALANFPLIGLGFAAIIGGIVLVEKYSVIPLGLADKYLYPKFYDPCFNLLSKCTKFAAPLKA